MKRLFFLLSALLMIILAGCNGAQSEESFVDIYDKEDAGESDIMVENEYHILRFDGNATQFSLTNKATGAVWHSNPLDAKEDTIAVASVQQKLQSQLLLNYGQINGSSTEIDNYSLSLSNGTYRWEPVENGIKVMYTLGKVDKELIVPPALSESRLMEYYERMADGEKRTIDNYYRIIDVNKLLATDDKDALLEQFPELEHERIFILRENLQKNIMERLETAFESVGYTREDFEEDKAAFEKSEESSTPVFCVSVIYQLDGPDFVVTVPLDELQYRSQYPILSLAVLPFFGAGGLDDEGYMFVPDASGALIKFNNGKENQNQYVNNLYGYDYGLKRTALMNDNGAYFPVFGINNNDASFICVIEDGKENGAIEADVSGRLNSYNYVYNRFTVINSEDIDISKANVFAKVFERKPLEGAYKQRYIFLDSQKYTDMAITYRDYMISHNPTLKKTNQESIPTMVEIVGAIDKTQNIMGVPVIISKPLTTYNETMDIITDLQDAGMKNMSVNLAGWFNGGVTHDAPANVNLISELGGKKNFAKLLDFVKGRDIDLYLEADFTYIYDLGVFNGYQVNRDSAKRISREVALMYPYSSVWFGEQNGTYGKRHSYYLASSQYTMSSIDSFNTDINKLGASNITFSAIGQTLNSNFNVKNPVSRKTAMEMQQEKMQELRLNGGKLAIHGGNDYAVSYADFIIDMKFNENGSNIIDEYIPFYQIVLHGLIPYTGGAVNLAPDYERHILKSVETGAGLYFSFMKASGQELQESRYTRYYASDINRWGNKPIELYKRLNDELAHTVDLFITEYDKLTSEATITGYEDGTRVIVNYGSEIFTYDGYEIKGKDFLVLR